MKKWFLFLVLILIVGLSYRITPVLAESKEDATAIKKVIENYFKGFAERDLNLVMDQFSPNFSYLDRKTGEVRYYAYLKSSLEPYFKFSKKNTSISDFKITNLNVQDNKATLEVEYNSETGVSVKQIFSLVKEGGSWKIITHPEYEKNPK